MTSHNGFDTTARLAALESETRLAVQQLLDWADQLDAARSTRVAAGLRRRATQLQRVVDTAGRIEVSERQLLVKSRPELHITCSSPCSPCSAGPGRSERCECCGESVPARDLVYDATGWRCKATGACTDRVVAAANVGEAI